MKFLMTILIFVLVGFAIVGLIHGNLFIVLTNFTAVKHDALVGLVISVCAGIVVSLLYD
jgi:ABC-type Mn2+/Zn2+ transport system permease subunit